MNAHVQVAVTTEFYGSGRTQRTEPRYIALTERQLSAGELIAEYVQAELHQAATSGASSLALAYLTLENPLRIQPSPSCYQEAAEISQAQTALLERRYM